MHLRRLPLVVCLALTACTTKDDPKKDAAKPAAKPTGTDKREGDAPDADPDAKPPSDPCAGAEEELHPIWNDERSQAMVAAHGESIPARLDGYAVGWVTAKRDACEATVLRGEASARVRALRADCLAERRVQLQALVDVLRGDDSPGVWSWAIPAMERLPNPSSCTTEGVLARPEPPEDRDAAKARLRGRGELAAAWVWLQLGAPGQARTLAQAVYDRAGEDQVLQVEARALLGEAQAEAGDVAAGIDNLQEAAWLAASIKHDEVAALAGVALVRAVGVLAGTPDDGLAWSRHAEAAMKRLDSGPSVQRRLKLAVADVQLVAGDGAAAQTTLETAARMEGDAGAEAVAIELGLVDAMLLQKKPDDAEDHLDDAATGIVDRLGEEHPWLGRVHALRARLAGMRGDTEEALRSLDKASALIEAGLGKGAPELVPIAIHRAHLELQKGDSAAAAATLDGAMATGMLADPEFGPGPLIDAQIARSKLFVHAGDLDRAREMLEKTAKTARKRGYKRRYVLGSLVLGQVCGALKDPDCARDALRLPASDRSVPAALRARAGFELAKQTYATDPVAARDYAEKAAKIFRDGGEATATHSAEAEAWLAKHPLK